VVGEEDVLQLDDCLVCVGLKNVDLEGGLLATIEGDLDHAELPRIDLPGLENLGPAVFRDLANDLVQL
jgi:hypothetical protein